MESLITILPLYYKCVNKNVHTHKIDQRSDKNHGKNHTLVWLIIEISEQLYDAMKPRLLKSRASCSLIRAANSIGSKRRNKRFTKFNAHDHYLNCE